MKELADRLLTRIVRAGKWPPEGESKVHKHLRTWRAIRESDRAKIKVIQGWPLTGRELHIDPLAERIAEAWATYLYGTNPTFEAPNESDQEALEALVEASELPSELFRGVDICASEGETWWRAYVDLRAADYPLLEFRTRDDVVPLWQGRKLLAVAVVDCLEEGGGRGSNQHTVWRHLEVHTDGRLENVLYRGTKETLGVLRPLTDHPETRDLIDVWQHDLPGKLAGRLPYKLGRDPRLGRSAFHSSRDYLLTLNEAATIGAENLRLTAKRRVVVPAGSVTPRARPQGLGGDLIDRGDGHLVPASGEWAGFDAGEDVLIADPLDREMGRESQPFKVLEYSFDADALIAYQRFLAESALTRGGLTPEWLGIPTEISWGTAATGTALRMRLVPTTMAGQIIARPWDTQVPRIMATLALLDQLPSARGGFGRPWTDVTPPSVERHDAIPPDPTEDDARHNANVAAKTESRYEAIRARHPDWDDKQITVELDRIDKDTPAPPPITIGGGFGGGGGGGPEPPPAAD